MTLDTKKFDASIKALIKENNAATKSALYKIGVVIVNEAEPLVPILEGNLVGSASISIGKRVMQFSPEGQAVAPKTGDAKDNELRVGYNMPYAYRLHEFPFNPGPKSKIKGLTKPGYKWMTRTIARLDIPALFKKFYKLKGIIK